MAELYSVRMRAAQGGPHEGGHHVPGAEPVVMLEEVGAISSIELADGMHCITVKGRAGFINITV